VPTIVKNNNNLLDNIRQGSKLAEKELVEKYYKSLFYIILKQSQDHSLSQDLCNETFIVVINKARNGEIKDVSAVGAFIRSVGINLLIETKRKYTRQKTDTSDTVELLCNEQQESVVDKLEKKQALALVQQVIQELPNSRDRELLCEYFLYGNSKESICKNYDLTPEHFSRVLYRARQRLKQLLAMKLDIDVTKLNVSHFLSLILVCAICTSLYTAQTNVQKSLRDISLPTHLKDVREVNNVLACDSGCSEEARAAR